MGIQDIFRKNLRALRDSLDKTQGEMAQCIDMDAGTYNRWESGKVWPPPDRVDALAGSLKVESWTLYADADKLNKPAPPIAPTPGAAELAELLTDARRELKEARARWDATAQEAANRIQELEEENEKLKSQLSLVTKPIVTSNNKPEKRYLDEQLVTKTEENVTSPDLLAAESALREFPEIVKTVNDLADVKRKKRLKSGKTS